MKFRRSSSQTIASAFAVAVITLGSAFLFPVQAGAQTNVYKFVGYSAKMTPVTPGVNVSTLVMDQYCRRGHGAGVRMCTSSEFFASWDVSFAPATAYAWVQPSIVAAYFDQNSMTEQVIDISGAEAATAANLSCNQWTSTTGTGLAIQFTSNGASVQPSGIATTLACSNAEQVACCAP